MPLWLLLVCVLCQPSHCGPTDGSVYSLPTSDGAPSLPVDVEPSPPDDVTDELTRLFESSFRPTPPPAPETPVDRGLAELGGVLRQLLAMVERLDTTQVSQLDMEKAQQALISRVDGMERSLRGLSGGLDTMQETQHTVTSRIDAMKSDVEDVSERVDLAKHTAEGVPDQVRGASEALGTLSAGLEALVASRGVLSDRLGALVDSRAAAAARLASVSASQTVQAAQLAEARRSLSSVTGRLDALLRLPITGGGGAYGGLLPTGGVPWQTLGTPCWADDECSGLVANAVCGEQRRCVCASGFRRVSDRLCRAIPRLGEPCSEDADCLVLTANSRCSSAGQCACQTGFSSKTDAECWPSRAAGASCSDRRQCAAGLDCVDDLCSCPVTRHDSRHISHEYRVGGGSDCSRGRVELRAVGNPRWHFVCDDHWEWEDASVFCRSIGSWSWGEALTGLEYNDGPIYYDMDDVRCSGDEKHLTHCSYDRRHDCSVTEIAGVVCKT